MYYWQLDDPTQAKGHYDRAVRWRQENEGKLSPQQQQELKAFRAEADALLRTTSPRP